MHIQMYSNPPRLPRIPIMIESIDVDHDDTMIEGTGNGSGRTQGGSGNGVEETRMTDMIHNDLYNTVD